MRQTRNKWMLAPGRVALALMALGLAKCSTRVVDTSGQLSPAGPASTALARPRNVVVVDFTSDRAGLRLDQGIGPRLQRAARSDSASADQEVMREDVQNAIADALVASIRDMGLPAERAIEAPPPGAKTVVVRGQILDIDQGNRTRRFGVGFGAGKSDVSAQVQVYYDGRLLQTYDADSNSGRKPGMALGGAMALGRGSIAPAVLTGVTGAASERNKSEVAKEGEKLGRQVGYDLGEFFARQGWVEPSAVSRPPLR